MDKNATLSFFATATASSTANQIIYSPVKGTINRITIAWPAASNFLVEVLFNLKRTQFVPTPAEGAARGIRLNNFTEQVNPDFEIEMRDPIEMFIINNDTINTHSIAAVMHIEKNKE